MTEIDCLFGGELTLDDYQRLAGRTCTDVRGAARIEDLAFNALGLNGEAGEVADEVKKVWRHGRELDKKRIGLELGDVLWYIAAICNDLGLKLSDVAAANVRKLMERYPDGFAPRERKVA